ncbi:MAG: flagellar protein FlaG [Desulfobacteraceae bacterium]|jgi:flagellar protein FlaG
MEAVGTIRSMESQSQALNAESAKLTSAQKDQRSSPIREPRVAATGKTETGPVHANEDTTRRVAEAMDKYVRSVQSDLQISIHDETGKIVVRVISRETGDVIREIPSEEMLKLAEKMEEMAGGLLRTIA